MNTRGNMGLVGGDRGNQSATMGRARWRIWIVHDVFLVVLAGCVSDVPTREVGGHLLFGSVSSTEAQGRRAHQLVSLSWQSGPGTWTWTWRQCFG